MFSQNLPRSVRKGLRLFNQKDFYRAHECFEDAWQQTPDDSREFFRALLQISAGYFRLTQYRPDAAKKFFSRTLVWLKPFPNHHLGFDVVAIRHHVKELIDAINLGLAAEVIVKSKFQPLQSFMIKDDEDKMKILISGFEPFRNFSQNISKDLVQALPDQFGGQITLTKTILPVDNVKGPARIVEAIYQYQPDAVLSFGIAANRKKINLERIAINLKDYRIPDNTGVQISDQPIIPNGPAAYFTTLPIRKMLNSLSASGIPASISLSAGAYLCNQVFYTVMHEINHNYLPIKAGFIHLPASSETDPPKENSNTFAGLEQFIFAANILINTLFDEN